MVEDKIRFVSCDASPWHSSRLYALLAVWFAELTLPTYTRNAFVCDSGRVLLIPLFCGHLRGACFQKNSFKESANQLVISILRAPIGVYWFVISLKELVLMAFNVPLKQGHCTPQKTSRTKSFKESSNQLACSILRMPVGVRWSADLKEFVLQVFQVPVKQGYLFSPLLFERLQ